MLVDDGRISLTLSVSIGDNQRPTVDQRTQVGCSGRCTLLVERSSRNKFVGLNKGEWKSRSMDDGENRVNAVESLLALFFRCWLTFGFVWL